MRAAWPTRPLGKICDIQIGRTPTRSEGRFWGGENPWLSIKDMNQGRDLRETAEGITDAAVEEQNCRLVEPGTVLMSFKLSIGKVGIAQRPMYTNEAIAQLPLTTPDMDRDYLYWALRTVPLTGDADRAAMGATLNKAKLKRIPIPVPPIEEQRRIAAVLDAADALRAKRREAVAKLDTLTRAIFIDTFGDPVTNPRSWDAVPLAELGSLDRGVSKHRPRNDPALLGGPWPLVQTGDVASSGGYIRAASGSYSDFGLAQSRLWPAGTLCITIAANIAKTGILTFDACFPDSVVGFASDHETTEFVRAFLGFLQPVLEANAPESAQKNINLKTLRTAMAPAPPRALRAEFADAVDAVRDQHSRLTKSDHGLVSLFSSLQKRAFRGEL